MVLKTFEIDRLLHPAGRLECLGSDKEQRCQMSDSNLIRERIQREMLMHTINSKTTMSRNVLFRYQSLSYFCFVWEKDIITDRLDHSHPSPPITGL